MIALVSVAKESRACSITLGVPWKQCTTIPQGALRCICRHFEELNQETTEQYTYVLWRHMAHRPALTLALTSEKLYVTCVPRPNTTSQLAIPGQSTRRCPSRGCYKDPLSWYTPKAQQKAPEIIPVRDECPDVSMRVSGRLIRMHAVHFFVYLHRSEPTKQQHASPIRRQEKEGLLPHTVGKVFFRSDHGLGQSVQPERSRTKTSINPLLEGQDVYEYVHDTRDRNTHAETESKRFELTVWRKTEYEDKTDAYLEDPSAGTARATEDVDVEKTGAHSSKASGDDNICGNIRYLCLRRFRRVRPALPF